MELYKLYNKTIVDYGIRPGSDYLAHASSYGIDLRAGISPDGDATILIGGKLEDSKIILQSSLSGINALFGVNCSVNSNNKIEDGIFNIISCTEEDENLKKFFFDFFENLLMNIANIDAKELNNEINNLSKLFSYKKKKSSRTMMGLWSELFIIDLVKNTDFWSKKWDARVRSTYDFDLSTIGIDVKSYGAAKREHYFKIQQLRNPSVDQSLILSMCLKEDDAGPSVYDLLASISSKLSNKKEINKIQKKIFKLAGEKIEDIKRYSESIATETLQLLNSSDIPSLNPDDVPIGVSEIKFKSDCSGITNGKKFNEENQKTLENGNLKTKLNEPNKKGSYNNPKKTAS